MFCAYEYIVLHNIHTVVLLQPLAVYEIKNTYIHYDNYIWARV